MYYTAYLLNVKIFLSLYGENHLGNCFMIQSVNCVSQDMSVLHIMSVSCANYVLVQRLLKFYMPTDIFYTFLSCMPCKAYVYTIKIFNSSTVSFIVFPENRRICVSACVCSVMHMVGVYICRVIVGGRSLPLFKYYHCNHSHVSGIFLWRPLPSWVTLDKSYNS